MTSCFFSRTRRAAVAVAFALCVALPGCGGSSDKEIEIVAPVDSTPVHNPDPKAPMANITPENEAQHPEVMKGATVPAGRR